LGYQTKLIPEAYVFHKRRISWSKFYKQVKKFGLTRPILNKWHPETKKITYWFPTFFVVGFVLSLFLLLIFQVKWLILFYLIYFFSVFILALFKTKSLHIASLSLFAITIQFFGYGIGFLYATILINLLKKEPRQQFPDLFFKKTC
jgi:hypothetical protein